VPGRTRALFGIALVAAALLLPWLPFADRNIIDKATLILIYVMLGWGLNIVVGLAGCSTSAMSPFMRSAPIPTRCFRRISGFRSGYAFRSRGFSPRPSASRSVSPSCVSGATTSPS